MNLNIKLSKYRARSRRNNMETGYDDDTLAPVMPAIDVVQQLMAEENRQKKVKERLGESNSSESIAGTSDASSSEINNEVHSMKQVPIKNKTSPASKGINLSASSRVSRSNDPNQSEKHKVLTPTSRNRSSETGRGKNSSLNEIQEEDDQSFCVRNNPLLNLISEPPKSTNQEEYELIPKSVILDVYSNDPEVKRFLKQLHKLYNESGYNEQDYKCYSCRRPVGLVFGHSRLCHFDGHHYCSECHLAEKSVNPARILCNWDFAKYPISKRNQHFLTLISNEPMFELKKVAPLLYKMCPELREIEELRRQAFFVRSYCATCVDESISFELTKLIWPREHLIKQTDSYSLEDLIQIKNGTIKQVLKNVITFGKQHVLSCVLCCQKGFICEICKSSQIIYPFDTESVYRCNECQSIYHKACFTSRPGDDACPRCQRLKARRNGEH